MFKRFSCMTIAALFFSAVTVAGLKAQDCQSCEQNTTASCNSQTHRIGSRLHGGSLGQGHFRQWQEKLKSQIEHLSRINELGTARNQAWPKPFACADRQTYFAIWNPMIETGWKETCVLSNNHFDTATNELNEAGRIKVAMIMRNNPVNQKSVFVARDHTAKDLDARLANVRTTVDRWYGLDKVNEIAFSDLTPIRGDGLRFETINRLGAESTAPPIIPVATGTGSTSDVSSGN